MENIKCAICKKEYKTKASLLQHNRISHNIYCYRKKDKENNLFKCSYCDNVYSHSQSRWKHEQKCNFNKKDEAEKNIIENLRKENEQLMKDKLARTEEIIRLQKRLLNGKVLNDKTFKAANKILIERSFLNSQINNNTTITNNTQNNTIHNHNQIIAFGYEEFMNVLTIQQKKDILDFRLSCIEKLVEIIHCGELHQFKNIMITNIKDNYAYRYDNDKKYFVTVPKKALLEDIVTKRMSDIEEIYAELKEMDVINERTKKIVQDLLDKMEQNEPVTENETRYENYKSFKIDKIKFLLYNNRENMSRDIALLISNDQASNEAGDNDEDDVESDDGSVDCENIIIQSVEPEIPK